MRSKLKNVFPRGGPFSKNHVEVPIQLSKIRINVVKTSDIRSVYKGVLLKSGGILSKTFSDEKIKKSLTIKI